VTLTTSESSAPRRITPRTEESCLLAELQSSTNDSVYRTYTHIVSISSGRHQAAEWLAKFSLNSQIVCWHIDSFHASRTAEQFEIPDEGESRGRPANLNVLCQTDIPDQKFDLGLISLVSTGETELARDHLQAIYSQLRIGGRLVAAVDKEEDRWLLEQLKSFEKSVKIRPQPGGSVYWIEKTAELKKRKDFACQLAFRDCEELVQLVTRPGVFSHRQLDNGARQLLDAVDVYAESRILNIGCGSGSVALALAKRDPSARVHAVDANARAIDCVQRGIRLNQLSNLTTEVNATGVIGEPDSYDMALANPPYFGDFRIAEKFIAAAQRSLRPGGRVVIVTKQPSWYQENLERWFSECEVFPSRRYYIASGVKSISP
jgi:16S rRNA G1207 methylase RsmC